MEEEIDESWLYGNSEGKETGEQPPGTENDAVLEKPDGSREKDGDRTETEPTEDPKGNQVS